MSPLLSRLSPSERIPPDGTGSRSHKMRVCKIQDVGLSFFCILPRDDLGRPIDANSFIHIVVVVCSISYATAQESQAMRLPMDWRNQP